MYVVCVAATEYSTNLFWPRASSLLLCELVARDFYDTQYTVESCRYSTVLYFVLVPI